MLSTFFYLFFFCIFSFSVYIIFPKGLQWKQSCATFLCYPCRHRFFNCFWQFYDYIVNNFFVYLYEDDINLPTYLPRNLRILVFKENLNISKENEYSNGAWATNRIFEHNWLLGRKNV